MRMTTATVRATRPGLMLLFCCAIAAMWFDPARAQDLYGCDNAGRMFIINTTTGAGTQLCTLPTHPDPGATEIDFDPVSGMAFVQARDGSFQGQRFDVSACGPVGALVTTGDLAFNGLEFVGGVLYGAGVPNTCSPSVLATLDPSTGAPTLIGPTGLGPVAGLAWSAGTQTMYGITGCTQQGPSQLVQIDLATGAATVIGTTDRNLGSLEFAANGLLYAGGDTRDGGNLYIIDPATGASTPVGATGFANVTGLALVQRPVPVLISGFEATAIDNGVRLEWRVWSDEDVTGFRIYRAASNSNAIALTGLLDAASRSYVDTSVQGGVEYAYTLAVVLADREVLSPVAHARRAPDAFTLDQNTPNPFNPSTTISFTLARRARATLTVHDVRGNVVRTLVDAAVGEGRHDYQWDGKNTGGTGVGSGVYFYRLVSEKQVLTKKMVLLK